MWNGLKKMAAPAIAAACLLIGAKSASALSILVDVGSPVVTAVSGGFNWDYAVSVTSSATVQSGDFFVIVDFAGYTGTHSQPAGWTATTEAITGPIVGLSGTVVAASDDAGTPNIRWTYTGATIPAGTALGHFVAKSVQNKEANGSLVAQDHNFNPGHSSDGLVDVNSQSITVPDAVPLPGVAVAGLSLFGAVGGGSLLRRRRQA